MYMYIILQGNHKVTRLIGEEIDWNKSRGEQEKKKKEIKEKKASFQSIKINQRQKIF